MCDQQSQGFEKLGEGEDPAIVAVEANPWIEVDGGPCQRCPGGVCQFDFNSLVGQHIDSEVFGGAVDASSAGGLYGPDREVVLAEKGFGIVEEIRVDAEPSRDDTLIDGHDVEARLQARDWRTKNGGILRH